MGNGVARARLRAAEVASVVVRRVPLWISGSSGCELRDRYKKRADRVSLPTARAVSIGKHATWEKFCPSAHRGLSRASRIRREHVADEDPRPVRLISPFRRLPQLFINRSVVKGPANCSDERWIA